MNEYHSLRSKSISRFVAGTSAPLTWILAVAVMPIGITKTCSAKVITNGVKQLLWHRVTQTGQETYNHNDCECGLYCRKPNIFKDKAVSVVVIFDSKSIQPFVLDKGMKGFDACVVVWIAFVAITYHGKPLRHTRPLRNLCKSE